MSDSRPETPEETWARLTAGTNTVPAQRGMAFPRRRIGTGYDVDEVDAFLQSINQRSVSEIKRSQFRVRGFGGYDMVAVDNFLEDVLQRRGKKA